MATQKLLYGATTAFTITLASLGSFAAREGTIVANSTNLYIDMIISGKITVGAAAASGNVYILLSSSDATNISYPATGSDAAITIPLIDGLSSLQPGQQVPGTALIMAYVVPTFRIAATTAVPIESFSVANLFNGQIPIGGIAPVVVNCQGQAFDATGGHFAINYTGVQYQIA